MNYVALTDATSLGDEMALAEAAPQLSLFSAMIQSARLELHASLQLLAERARFLTGACGVAIALEEDGQFSYCASVGTSVPEAETSADSERQLVRDCIRTAKPVRGAREAADETPAFSLAVPIVRMQQFAGFFELMTENAEFSREDIQAVSRLAEFAETALDHMAAAQQAESRMFAAEVEAPKASPLAPPQWHAPDQATAVASVQADYSPSTKSAIRICRSCGFPVSPGRALCLDCEENPASAALETSSSLLTEEQQESWISAHGYTIASILVTGLAAAIIFWLR